MSPGITAILPDYNGNVSRDIKPKIAGTNKRPNYQRHLKLPDTYSRLIAMAIKESKNKMVTLHEIQAFLKARYSCFNGTYTGWKNSLRHNLSANPAFVKVLRDGGRPRGKDNYWTIDESAGPLPGKDRERDGKPATAKRKRCPIAKSENASKARALPFSIENLLRPSAHERRKDNPECIPTVTSTTEGYPPVPGGGDAPAKRPCHRVQVVPSIGTFAAPVWGRVQPVELYHCEERIPVCYSDRFRDEEFRNSRQSVMGGGGGVLRRSLITCELEGCEVNHQEELIVCELENCNVCKPWPVVKREPKSAYAKNPLQYTPRHLDADTSGEQVGDVPFDFSQYEVDTGRLENLRESLEVQACGGVKAARIREED